MVEFMSPISDVEHVQRAYDGIFYGFANESDVNLPFGYDAIALNGTKRLADDPDAADIYTGTRFGVFVSPHDPTLYETMTLVTDHPSSPDEDRVLRTVQGLRISPNDEKTRYQRPPV